MKFIDLFAGIGGFRLGLERTGHEPVGWIENDKFARKSYEAIHEPDGEFTAEDARSVDPENIPDFEILCAGFPCQSFSIAGKRGGFDDIRGTLFFEIARIARTKLPEILFLENVKGLLNHSDGKTFDTILSTIHELGYSVEWQVLNSKHFGVPQNRERVFIIGHLGGFGGRQVFPIRRTSKQSCNQVEKVEAVEGHDILKRVYDVKGTSPQVSTFCGGNQEPFILNNDGSERGDFSTVSAGGNSSMDDSEADFICHPVRTPEFDNKHENKKDRVGSSDGNMWTVDGSSIHGVTDGKAVRKLTPKECWRLQGFPDWAFERAEEVNSDTQLYKQAGNAVTVNVIEAIGKRLNQPEGSGDE